MTEHDREAARIRRDREAIVSADRSFQKYGYRAVDRLMLLSIASDVSEIREAALCALDELFKLLGEEPTVKGLDRTRKSVKRLNAKIGSCRGGSL
jgi:hypothetical protein